MIIINNLSKSYDGKTLSVNNLNLMIEDGEIFGLIGHNGAGKSTTLKMLTGILNGDTGDILVNGHDIFKNPVEAKREMAFVSDEPNMFLKFRAHAFLDFILDVYEVPKEKRAGLINKYVELFELKDVLYDCIGSFSHGMRQKFFLVSALIHEPKILVLDEPLTGLDPKAIFTLKQIMNDYKNSGKTVLFSSHVLDVVEKICDRIAIMAKGRLLFTGTIEEFKVKFALDDMSLEEAYLHLLAGENVDINLVKPEIDGLSTGE